MGSIYDDLNRSLFLQLDKLQDCEPEDIEYEIERSKQANQVRCPECKAAKPKTSPKAHARYYGIHGHR